MSHSPKDDGAAGFPGRALLEAGAKAGSGEESLLEALRSAFALAGDPAAIRQTRDRIGSLATLLDQLLMQIESPSRARGQEARARISEPSATGYLDGRVKKGLSAREIEIVRLVSEGRSVGYIAQALDISPYTVRNHLKTCYRKVGVHTQIELINLVLDQGLVTSS